MNSRENFYYAYGRTSSKNGHYSIMSMRVDPVKSSAHGRIMTSGHLGKTFAPPNELTPRYVRNSAWGKVEEMAIIRIRCEVARTGFTAHVGEAHILLYQAGPVFCLDLNVPTGILTNTNQIRVFMGPGRILSVRDLEQAGFLRRVTTQVLDTVYDPSAIEDDEWADSHAPEPYALSMFEYTEEMPAVGREPVLKFVNVKDKETKEIVTAPVYERDSRLRRRIVIPK